MRHLPLLIAVAMLSACSCNDPGTDEPAPPDAPVISLSPSPATTTNEVVVNLDEPTVDPEGSPVEYDYRWLSGDGLSWTQDTLPGAATQKGETWTVTVEPYVRGVRGLPASATVDIINTPPVLASASFAATPTLGQDLVCVPATATDADEDSVIYAFQWAVDSVVLGTAGDTLASTEFGLTSTIRCTVTPNDGEEDGDSVYVEGGVDNGPPTVASATITPTSPTSSDALTCTAGATADPDGDGVTVSYAWQVNGTTLTGETSSTLNPGGYVKTDAVTCIITPNDGLVDGTPATSAAVSVLNSVPSIAGATLAPDPPRVGDTVTCTPGAATDADNDTVTYTYEWTLGGTVQSETGPWFLLETGSAGLTIGCTVTPNDGEADGSSVTATPLTVDNTPPVLSGTAITPDPAYAGNTLTCTTGTPTDADGDTVTLSYAWLVNGSGPVGTSTTLSTGFGRGDVVTCSVTPNDSTADGVASSANLTISNTLPVVDSVAITPTSTDTTTDLTCVPSTSDADTDTVTPTYAWTINTAAAGSNSATLSSSLFSRDDVVVCTVTPNDGTNSGTAVAASIVIGNALPAGTTPQIGPSSPATDTTLTCTPAGWSDADSDSEDWQYSWAVNTGTLTSQTSSTLSGSQFAEGQDVTCTATPYDGIDTGTPLTSAPLTILNSPPTQPVIGITPSSPTAGQALTCNVLTDSTDPDNESLSYTATWTVNGGAYASPTTTTNTGDTIPASITGATEFWECTMVANDGTVNGPADTASVTVTGGSSLGDGPNNPGVDCLDIFTVGASNGDALYWIDPDNTGSFQAWCNMVDGGWTLVANIENGYPFQNLPAPFFTSSLLQDTTAWTANASNATPIEPTTPGVLDVTAWNTPGAIRYELVQTATGVRTNSMDFTASAAVTHLQQYTAGPAATTGQADGVSTAHGALTMYYASDHLRSWYYWGGIMGRSPNPALNTWQFGISINQPDGVNGYDGIHDDQNRAEFNIGVGTYVSDAYDISGLWPGQCATSCNEWPGTTDGEAAVYTWHR